MYVHGLSLVIHLRLDRLGRASWVGRTDASDGMRLTLRLSMRG